ncbi:MAG: sugar kinase [Chitinispirillia bacterium]|nr:sugar kinase [Chitinispirillia bacterium]MCL2268344.1 sugar kinase [Chitinispirillia bacterium]
MGSSKSVYNRDTDLLVIGECMVEFSCEDDVLESESYQKDIGGADIVVAATAARLGSRVQLVSSVARDPFHGFIRGGLAEQNIDISHVVTCQGYNGLYFTSSQSPEQREYLVHHPGTANRQIVPSLVYDEMIERCKIVYASSELQSVSKQTWSTIFKAFHFAHQNGIMVAYDPNIRLMRWSLEEARMGLCSVMGIVDVIFISSPEESMALLGYKHPFEVIGYLRDRGFGTVVVKMGAEGCMVGCEEGLRQFPQPPEDAAKFKNPVLVGSAFNGGFLHSIARGYDPFRAAEMANSVALYKGVKGGGIDSLPTAADLIQ